MRGVHLHNHMAMDHTLTQLLTDEQMESRSTPSREFSDSQVAIYNCFREFVMACVAEWEGDTLTDQLCRAEVYTMDDFMHKMQTDYEEEFHECMRSRGFHVLRWSEVSTIVLFIVTRVR